MRPSYSWTPDRRFTDALVKRTGRIRFPDRSSCVDAHGPPRWRSGRGKNCQPHAFAWSETCSWAYLAPVRLPERMTILARSARVIAVKNKSTSRVANRKKSGHSALVIVRVALQTRSMCEVAAVLQTKRPQRSSRFFKPPCGQETQSAHSPHTLKKSRQCAGYEV